VDEFQRPGVPQTILNNGAANRVTQTPKTATRET
jgi:hypothetical protein